MSEHYGLTVPRPDASDQEWKAYRQAWSERAMAAERAEWPARLQELQTKVSPEDGQRALAAFNAVLLAANVDGWTAAMAQFKLEGWDEAGFPEGEEPTAAEHHAAEAWRNAVGAGEDELCDKPPLVSRSAVGLVDFLGREKQESSVEWFPLKLASS